MTARWYSSDVGQGPRPRISKGAGVHGCAVDDLELVEPVGVVVPATDEEAADVVVAFGLVVAQIHVLVVDAHDLHLARLVRHAVARAARQTGPAL